MEFKVVTIVWFHLYDFVFDVPVKLEKEFFKFIKSLKDIGVKESK